jgi:hypothetical protein
LQAIVNCQNTKQLQCTTCLAAELDAELSRLPVTACPQQLLSPSSTDYELLINAQQVVEGLQGLST